VNIIRWLASIPCGLLAGFVGIYLLPLAFSLLIEIVPNAPRPSSVLGALNGLMFVYGISGWVASAVSCSVAPNRRHRSGFSLTVIYTVIALWGASIYPDPVTWKGVVGALCLIGGSLIASIHALSKDARQTIVSAPVDSSPEKMFRVDQ